MAAVRDIGVAVDQARVLYEGSSVIVGFGPQQPIARVGGLTASVRDLLGHYGREVAIACHPDRMWS